MELIIEQQRAKYALQCIQHLADNLPEKSQGELISYANSLPAMIHMNGLGQAMAFCKLKAKDRDSYHALYQLVSDWLCQDQQPYAGKGDVMTGITECDRQHYQLAQAEALALMNWVKKFAKAFLKNEESQP